MINIENFLVKIYDKDLIPYIGYVVPASYNDNKVRLFSYTTPSYSKVIEPSKICRCVGVKLNEFLFDWDVVEIKMHSGNTFHYLIQWNEERCSFEAFLPYQCEFNGKHFYDNICNPIAFDDIMLDIYDPYGFTDSIKIVGNVYNYSPLSDKMFMYQRELATNTGKNFNF